MAYLIANANIFDGTGREPFRGVVRVEAERIAAVIPGADTPDAAGATVIDGRGATLMPGLIESHAHLGLADRRHRRDRVFLAKRLRDGFLRRRRPHREAACRSEP
jgi:imidazolonepropionase-like amidohydrolase